MNPNRPPGGGYYPGDRSNFGPMHQQRQRPHDAALTAPAPYAGGPRPSGTEMYNRPAVAAPLYQDFNAPPKPHQLTVSYKTNSVQAEVTWVHPPVAKNTAYTWEVKMEGGQNNNVLKFPQWKKSMKLRVTPGTWYKVGIRALAGTTALAIGEVEFKSVFDTDELVRLYQKACVYCGERVEPFEILYRHKPTPYWDNIRLNRNNIMEKYIKDKNGQPATPINDVIYGLFFSANLVNGTMPLTSPFGDVRIMIPAAKLLNPRTKLYFADFYCNYSTHYITIVVCVAGSETDRYCAKALLPLDPAANPFLRIIEKPGWLEFYVNTGIWVEVYYTENVEIGWGYFDKVKGLGRSKPGGLPNNKHCVECNLYPVDPDGNDIVVPNLRPSTTTDKKDGDESRKRPHPEDDDDCVIEDFRTKKAPLATITLDEEDKIDSNSTFKLAVRVKKDELNGELIGVEDFDIMETLCSTVDAAVAEVGDKIDVPAHGFVGKPYVSKPAPPPDAKLAQIIPLEKLNQQGKTDIVTPEGIACLTAVRKKKSELDVQMGNIHKMLLVVEGAVNALTNKLKELRK